jgi:hypothetical protein
VCSPPLLTIASRITLNGITRLSPRISAKSLSPTPAAGGGAKGVGKAQQEAFQRGLAALAQ